MLTSADGVFSCTEEAGLEAAYLLNMAEAVSMAGGYREEIGEILMGYVSGSRSAEECIAEFYEWLKEIEEDTE